MSLASIANLQDRAKMLASARAFLVAQNVMEVDCPSITRRASVDAHIDLIEITINENEKRFLFSSPEYGMKRLLANGIGDIFQISHVFRDGEVGNKHNPEFTMAEWYRIGISFDCMIKETLDFIRLFLDDQSAEQISYREAFSMYTGIDYVKVDAEYLFSYIQDHNIPFYPDIKREGKDALLNLILGHVIEPQLGKDKLCVLSHYPASQCALAQTTQHDDEEVAERFEIYYQGTELANGYHELTDACEQRTRFQDANQQRKALGKQPLPIDEAFLEALEKGLPDCCGVAVGFDRLMMLRHRAQSISDVIPFDWDSC